MAADEVRRVDYHYTTVPHEPGEGARVLEGLRDAGVNLLAFHAFPVRGGAQLDFVAEDGRAFREAAGEMGLELSDGRTAFLVDGQDRPGAAAELLGKLARTGINVVAMDALCTGDGRYAALLWVDTEDVGTAARALGLEGEESS